MEKEFLMNQYPTLTIASHNGENKNQTNPNLMFSKTLGLESCKNECWRSGKWMIFFMRELLLATVTTGIRGICFGAASKSCAEAEPHCLCVAPWCSWGALVCSVFFTVGVMVFFLLPWFLVLVLVVSVFLKKIYHLLGFVGFIFHFSWSVHQCRKYTTKPAWSSWHLLVIFLVCTPWWKEPNSRSLFTFCISFS